MLTVHIPETCRGEIEYVLQVCFCEWLGVLNGCSRQHLPTDRVSIFSYGR